LTDALISDLVAGSRRALARILSLIERDPLHASDAMSALHAHAGGAYRIGLTGPPGAGKSTLVDGLVRLLRADDKTVGVVAVDPTSAFSGGAVLGDRIRMRKHSLDDGVFIRSLATRGARGGLSRAAGAAVVAMDAFGMDFVIVESVGVGQTELDIMGITDTVVVALVPEAGDAVQALKAGLIEIADIVVVNKADRQGAEGLAATVEGELRGRNDMGWWMPPVLLTRAHRGLGLDELLKAIDDHREQAEKTLHLEQRRSERRRRQFARAVRDAVDEAVGALDLEDGVLGEIVARVERGEIDPDSAAAEALSEGDLLSRLARDLGSET
jgi:LAO/AO transport system kinase